MSRLRYYLDARNAPMWIKLLVTISVVLLMVLIPVLLIVRSGSQALASEINEITTNSVGPEQVSAVDKSVTLLYQLS